MSLYPSMSWRHLARLIRCRCRPSLASTPPTQRSRPAADEPGSLTKSNLALVGTFQAAGVVGALLFDNFGDRVGQLANQPTDRPLDSADLVITVATPGGILAA
jgi:acetolactate synthase I/II/III large subunit